MVQNQLLLNTTLEGRRGFQLGSRIPEVVPRYGLTLISSLTPSRSTVTRSGSDMGSSQLPNG